MGGRRSLDQHPSMGDDDDDGQGEPAPTLVYLRHETTRQTRKGANSSQRCVSLSCAADCPPPLRHPFFASTKRNGIQEGGKKEDLASNDHYLAHWIQEEREEEGEQGGRRERRLSSDLLTGTC